MKKNSHFNMNKDKVTHKNIWLECQRNSKDTKSAEILFKTIIERLNRLVA